MVLDGFVYNVGATWLHTYTCYSDSYIHDCIKLHVILTVIDRYTIRYSYGRSSRTVGDRSAIWLYYAVPMKPTLMCAASLTDPINKLMKMLCRSRRQLRLMAIERCPVETCRNGLMPAD